MYLHTVKISKFYAYWFVINSKKDLTIIEQIKQEHKKAIHYCYAYLIKNNESENGGYSNDGEPSGSVGKLIFHLLRIQKRFNCLVVVVRYWGGKN